MSEFQEFIKDLEALDKYSEKLTPQAFFIAGIGACKSGTNAELIFKYLAYAHSLFDKGILNNTNRTIIEYHFYKGSINEAKRLLKGYKSNSNKDLLESQSEIISQEIQEKNESQPMEIDKIKPKIETLQTQKKFVIMEKNENNEKNEKIESEKVEKPEKIQCIVLKAPIKEINIPKMTTEEIKDCEFQISDILKVMRRLDEKELLRLRKVEEEKRRDVKSSGCGDNNKESNTKFLTAYILNYYEQPDQSTFT